MKAPAPRAKDGKAKRKDPELFLNRELSWLEFDARVLEEAQDPAVPLAERLKFAIIASTNLDEFCMVRVAALKDKVAEGDVRPDPAGLTPARQLQVVSERAHALSDQIGATVVDHLLPRFAEKGVRLLRLEDLDDEQKAAIHRLFEEEVFPALTPLAIDSARPFPALATLSLNVAVILDPGADANAPRLGVVQVPAGLRRLVRLPGPAHSFVLLEDVIRAELSSLFRGQTVLAAAAFRIARDAELDLDDEGGRDRLADVEEELLRRRRGGVIRLEVDALAPEGLRDQLAARVGLEAEDVYALRCPLDLRGLFVLVELPVLDDAREIPLKPLPALEAAEMEDIFGTLDARDVLLHHPYESFDPVVALLQKAADDPGVLAIKQTLYRTSGDSPIVEALARAARNDKQVTVLMELTARFDEQSNIRWARRLEEAGAHVLYGVKGYKTHSKICLVVRRGREGIRRYVHLGTGNYNDRTARLYTDFGLMTADRAIGEDASAVFNAITGDSDLPRLKRLAMAPHQLRERFLFLIDRERRRAEEGQAAEIRAKVNSLADEDIVRALYAASQAGVRIRLNVRGICTLRPGVKGVSETIEVTSVVDRFLEHARIFHFRNGGDDEVYLASADWMGRNLDGRLELMFPVPPRLRGKVLDALEVMLGDNVKARKLQADGSYKRRRPGKGEEPFRSQLVLYERTKLGRARAQTTVALEPLSAPENEPR